MANFYVIPLDNTKLMLYNKYTNKERRNSNGRNHDEFDNRRT